MLVCKQLGTELKIAKFALTVGCILLVLFIHCDSPSHLSSPLPFLYFSLNRGNATSQSRFVSTITPNAGIQDIAALFSHF